jgi:hypothetical protein
MPGFSLGTDVIDSLTRRLFVSHLHPSPRNMVILLASQKSSSSVIVLMSVISGVVFRLALPIRATMRRTAE